MATGLDLAAAEAVIAARTPTLDRVAEAATLVGEAPVIAVLALTLVGWAWMRGFRRQAMFVAVSLASGAGIEVLMKLAVSRQRPPAIDALVELPHTFSFPSGHSFAVMLLGLLATWIVWQATQTRCVRCFTLASCVGAALATGWSRVYLGVHWATDVAAGWALAAAWFVVTAWIWRAQHPADSTGTDSPEDEAA